MNPTKQQRRYLRAENQRFGTVLEKFPESDWPDIAREKLKRPTEVWRSRHFVLQVWPEPNGITRLSIHRSDVKGDGNWRDGITWDDLQRLKHEAGYGDRCAIEVFPPSEDVVNVANIRHLWVLPEPPAFMWAKGKKSL